MRLIELIVFLFLIFEFCKNEKVLELNEDKFNEVSDRSSIWFIKFYAPWCGHCKRLSPTWDLLSEEIGRKAKIARVDCTKNSNLCSMYGIRGYPTLKLFAGGKYKADFKGKREIIEFKRFIESNSDLGLIDSDGIYRLNDENYELAFTNSENSCWDVLFYVPWNKDCRRAVRRFKRYKEKDEMIDCNKAMIDVTLSKNLVKKYEIQGVPLILNIKN